MHKWKKLGLIFNPTNRFDWMVSHATTPVPIHLSGDVFRVFFSTRNHNNQNQTAYVDIDLTNPQNILKVSRRPAFELGQLGAFDCDGVYMTSIVEHEGKLFGYYGGWNAGKKGLFYSKIGLAVSHDKGESFQRISHAPILNIDQVDPLSTMAPFVIYEKNIWKMWYASAIRFFYEKDKLKSEYTIKYAYSNNGFDWKKSNIISLELGENDSNIARACIYKKKDLFVAWYPVVAKPSGQYRIGYAESDDGIRFVRKDNLAGISKSSKEFDNKAITYPYVIQKMNKLLMFYNGNNFGEKGFGLAVSKI